MEIGDTMTLFFVIEPHQDLVSTVKLSAMTLSEDGGGH